MQHGDTINTSHTNSKGLRNLFNTQRIAMTILNINLNNVITSKFYIFLLVIESIFYFYHLAMIVLIFTVQDNEQRFWLKLELYINQLNNTSHLVIQSLILAFNVLLTVLFLILLVRMKGFVKIKKDRLLKQIFMTLVTIYGRVLSFPILNLIFRTLIQTAAISSTNIGGLSEAIINLGFIIAYLIVYKRLAVLKIPDIKIIPWAKSDDLSDIFSLLYKILIVVMQIQISLNSRLIDYKRLISILLLLADLFIIAYTFLRCHIYCKLIDYTQKLISLSGCGILIVLNINIGYGIRGDLLYYEIPVIIIQLMFIVFFLQRFYAHYLLSKSTFDSFKMEFEYTYFLILIQEQLRTLQNTPIANSKHIVSTLFNQVSNHQQTCTSYDCYCQFLDTVLWISDQRRLDNQEIVTFNIESIADINDLSEENDFFIQNLEQANYSYGTYKKYDFKKLKQILNDKQKIKKDVYSLTKTEDLTINEITINLYDIKENEEKEMQEIRIDVKRLFECYFGNMMSIYFEYGQKRFHNNHTILLLNAHYQFNQVRNIFQSTNLLQKLSERKFGILQNINMYANECYLNFFINKTINEQSVFEDGFNCKQMGKLHDKSATQNSQLLVSIDNGEFIEYQNLLENFKQSIFHLSYLIFNFWKELISEEVSVNEVIKTSQLFSDQLGITQSHFRELSQRSHHHSSSIYYQYAILNKELLNDKESYDVYMQKCRHIQNMQKTFSKEIKNKQQQYHDLGILIVGASQKNVIGRILKCNDFMKTVSGYKQDELKGQSYEKIMNQLIASWHSGFMGNFLAQGQSQKINKKKINQFILQKNGHIAPMELTIKYYYNEIYGYSFTCFIQLIKELTIEYQLFQTDQLIFIMCDNINGKIYDICENADKYLGIKHQFVVKNQSYLQQDLLITDLISTLDINKINEKVNNGEILQNTNQYKGISTIDIQQLKQKLGYGNSYKQSENPLTVSVDFYMFRESFLNSKYQMNILILKLNNSNDGLVTNGKSPRKTGGQTSFNEQYLLNINSNEIKFEYEEDQFSSASSASSSSRQSDVLNAQEILFKKHLPRRIKIVLQLFAFMFLTMIVISIINLNLQTSKQNKLILDIEVVRQGFVKIHWATRLRMSVRLLISTANGYESSNSTIIPDKLSSIYAQIFKAQRGLLDAQIYIENADFDYSPEFAAYAKTPYIPVEYLDQQAYTFKQNHTLSYLINTISAKTLEIYNMDIKRLKGRLEMQTIFPGKRPFSPTEDEQTIFFVGQNGNNAMRYYNFLQADAYANDIKLFAKENMNFMLTTMIISIATIICVFVIITPIIGMIFDKQFTSIRFFVEIPMKLKLQCFQKTNQFLDLLIDEQGHQTKVSKFTIPQEDKSRNSISQYFLQSQSNDNSVFGSNLELSNNNITNNLNTNNNNNTTFQTQNNLYDFNAAEVITFNDQTNVTDIIGNNNKEKDHKSVTLDHSEKSANQTNTTNKQKQDHIFAQLDKQKVKRRWNVIIANFITMSIFCMYFVAAYLISNKLYSSIDLIIPDLITIYFKDICVENVMIYSRENQIRNYSLIFPENGKVASSSFLLRCMNYENLYRQIRKNPHPAFQYAIDYIEIIETNKICDYVYKDDPVLEKACKQAYDGILNKGVSSAIQLMLQYFQKQDLKFTQNRFRTYKDLLQLNLDEDTMKLIEIKVFLLDLVFENLKELVTHSVGTYFNGLTTSYIILFSCFITFLILFIAFIFGYIMTKIQNYLWKINLSLKILPTDGLSREKVQEIKALLKS